MEAYIRAAQVHDEFVLSPNENVGGVCTKLECSSVIARWEASFLVDFHYKDGSAGRPFDQVPTPWSIQVLPGESI